MIFVSDCGVYTGVPSPTLVSLKLSPAELEARLAEIECEPCRESIRKWFIEQLASALSAASRRSS
jgi:hypothetical protein